MHHPFSSVLLRRYTSTISYDQQDTGIAHTVALTLLLLGLPDFRHLVLVRLCDEGILVLELITLQLSLSLNHLLLSP